MENRYGVDVTYFEVWNDRIFNSESGLTNYKPDELARELARMSRTADSEVLKEPEFNDRLFNQSELDQRIEQACREQRERCLQIWIDSMDGDDLHDAFLETNTSEGE